jgi:hypothetical protein
MQFRKPLLCLAAPGLCTFLIVSLAAQQDLPHNTGNSTSPKPPSPKNSGSSQTSVTVSPPDVPKGPEAPAAGKKLT